MPLVLIAASLALGLQKPLPNNAVYADVPDHDYVYDLLRELKGNELLPELDADDLVRGDRPLTRGDIGRLIVQAAMNVERYVDHHRRVESVGGSVRYSDTMSDFTGEQLNYLVALEPRLRKVGKAFEANLPPYVKWTDFDRSLEAEGKLVDGLLAGG